jgi:hypothetical protein
MGSIALIRLYRATLSSALGGQCRFYPSCSHYAEDVIRIHGATKGIALSAWRIARCGPFTRGGVDHVPPPRRGHRSYDTITHERVDA